MISIKTQTHITHTQTHTDAEWSDCMTNSLTVAIRLSLRNNREKMTTRRTGDKLERQDYT